MQPNGHHQLYGTARINVVKLIVQATGTYADQYRRPFTTDANSSGQILDAISQAVERQHELTPQNFVIGSPTSFITMSATPENGAPIPIANGWGERRLRFTLQLRHVDHIGNSADTYISGYTERLDLSPSGQFDPRMAFFMDDITTVRTTVVSTPYGQKSQYDIADTSQLLIDRNYQNAYGDNKIFSLRPEDAFSNLQNSVLTSSGSGTDAFVLDTRTTLSGLPVKSKRANAVAPKYSAALLNTYLQASQHHDLNERDLLVECQQVVASQDATRDPFIQWLMERRRNSFGHTQINFDNTWTYDDLLALDPNTPAVTETVPFVGQGQHTRGDTVGWGGTDPFTLAASILAQSVPSYLAEQGFTFAIITATNMGTVGGQIVTLIPKHDGWNTAAANTGQAVKSLAWRLQCELFPSICHQNTMAFDVEMKVALYGETWIKLSLNGESHMLYCAPTFAGALSTPMVTLNRGHLDGISNAVQMITQNIHENQSGSSNGLSLSGDVHI